MNLDDKTIAVIGLGYVGPAGSTTEASWPVHYPLPLNRQPAEEVLSLPMRFYLEPDAQARIVAALAA